MPRDRPFPIRTAMRRPGAEGRTSRVRRTDKLASRGGLPRGLPKRLLDEALVRLSVEGLLQELLRGGQSEVHGAGFQSRDRRAGFLLDLTPSLLQQVLLLPARLVQKLPPDPFGIAPALLDQGS